MILYICHICITSTPNPYTPAHTRSAHTFISHRPLNSPHAHPSAHACRCSTGEAGEGVGARDPVLCADIQMCQNTKTNSSHVRSNPLEGLEATGMRPNIVTAEYSHNPLIKPHRTHTHTHTHTQYGPLSSSSIVNRAIKTAPSPEKIATGAPRAIKRTVDSPPSGPQRWRS